MEWVRSLAEQLQKDPREPFAGLFQIEEQADNRREDRLPEQRSHPGINIGKNSHRLVSASKAVALKGFILGESRGIPVVLRGNTRRPVPVK